MVQVRKEQLVASMQEVFASAATVVVFHNRGLSVMEMKKLRDAARKAGADVRVTKNTLARIALRDTPFKALDKFFEGPTVIIYSDDTVAPAKVIVEEAKKYEEEKKIQIVGGGIQSQVIDVSGVQSLAKLESLDELRAKIARIIMTPATRLATVLQAPAGQLARVVNAYATKE